MLVNERFLFPSGCFLLIDGFLQGVKEVTLLGQNVNSYRDTSEEQFCGSNLTQLSRGFRTIYKTKRGGLRFSDLLDQVSLIDSDMRIRFTSPHPKDFPDEVRATCSLSPFQALKKLLVSYPLDRQSQTLKLNPLACTLGV